jgi:hypothetical protein
MENIDPTGELHLARRKQSPSSWPQFTLPSILIHVQSKKQQNTVSYPPDYQNLTKSGAGDVNSVTELVLNMLKALASIPCTTPQNLIMQIFAHIHMHSQLKSDFQGPGVVMHTCSSRYLGGGGRRTVTQGWAG